MTCLRCGHTPANTGSIFCGKCFYEAWPNRVRVAVLLREDPMNHVGILWEPRGCPPRAFWNWELIFEYGPWAAWELKQGLAPAHRETWQPGPHVAANQCDNTPAIVGGGGG